MSLAIRPFEAADLDRLVEITVEAFEPVSIENNIEQQMGGPINGRDWRWRKARHIHDDARREPEGIFIAEQDGRIVGYITTWHDSDSGVGNIPNLAVIAECRGQGVGRQLITHALDHFRKLGLAYARIETLEQNAVGQSLYPSLGFREIARQVYYGMPLKQPDDSKNSAI